MNYTAADKHLEDVDKILEDMIAEKIKPAIAADALCDHGYSFFEAWEQVHEARAKSKVIKIK